MAFIFTAAVAIGTAVTAGAATGAAAGLIGAGVAASAAGGLNAAFGGPSTPPRTDFTAAANAQNAANLTAAQQTARLSNPNITTPYGKQTVTYGSAPTVDYAAYNQALIDYQNNPRKSYEDEYGQIIELQAEPTIQQFTTAGDPNQANVTQTLTPDAQAALDAQMRVQKGLAQTGEKALGAVQDRMSTPFQYQGPKIQTSLGMYAPAQTSLDLSNVAKMPVNAGMTGQNAIMSRLNPQIESQNATLAQNLANQGVTPGSQAWNTAMMAQGQSNNDMLNQAALYGINLDMTANQQGYGQALNTGQFYNQGAAQNFNQGLGAAQFGNTAQQQDYAQQLENYNLPMNTLNSLMSGSQIQTPQFQGYTGSQVDAAPIFDAAKATASQNMGIYGQQVAQNNATTQGLFSLGGSALGAGFGKLT
jgi:hypothetical protein